MSLEELPEGTHFTDVLEAAQAAWVARDYQLARELIQRYIDADGEFCCMRCAATEHQPWTVRNKLGTFYVCPDCSTEVSRRGELFEEGSEMFIVGPTQKVTQMLGGYEIGHAVTIQTTKSKRVTITKK